MERGTDPDEIWGNTARDLFLLGQLLVRRRRRMDHERLGVADIGKVTRQPERVDDLTAHHRVAALHAKAQHAPKRALPERPEGQLVRRVRHEAEVGHPGDLLVLFEVLRESERIVRVALRAERERLEAL